MSNLTEYVKSLPACPEGGDCPLGEECDLYHHHKKGEKCWYIANRTPDRPRCPRSGCNGEEHDTRVDGKYECWFEKKGSKCTNDECPGFHLPKGKSVKSISTLKKNPKRGNLLKVTSTLGWKTDATHVEEKKDFAEMPWVNENNLLNLFTPAIDPKHLLDDEEESSPLESLESVITDLVKEVTNLKSKSESDEALIRELQVQLQKANDQNAQLQKANDQIAPLQEKVKVMENRISKITSLVSSGLKKK